MAFGCPVVLYFACGAYGKLVLGLAEVHYCHRFLRFVAFDNRACRLRRLSQQKRDRTRLSEPNF